METITIIDEDTGEIYTLSCPPAVAELFDELYGQLEDGRYITNISEINCWKSLLTEQKEGDYDVQ